MLSTLLEEGRDEGKEITMQKHPVLITLGILAVVLTVLLVMSLLGTITPVTCKEPASRYEAYTPSRVQITVYEDNMIVLVNRTDRTLAYDRQGSIKMTEQSGSIKPGESVIVPCGLGKLIDVYEGR